MKKKADQKKRWGYRRITAHLNKVGWSVSTTRIERLWRLHRLQVPQRQRKRRYLHLEGAAARHLTAQYRGHVWSYDFVFDVTENGRTLKAMPVVDEFTRECHSILVGRTINAAGAAREIRRLVGLHGAPAFIRSDNGPEFIARALREELAALGTETRYIEPGSPWQNAYVESFNARLRDEVLDRELFGNFLEAQTLIERWRLEYNKEHPHSSLGYQSPSEFAQSLNPKPALILT
ncbi:MAG: putative transposase [Thalassolituus oleivorans]|jgi:putative transposase